MFETKNPSAIRSQKEITEALIRLMNAAPYEEISVKQILLEAKLAQKTFYTEDILFPVRCSPRPLVRHIHGPHRSFLHPHRTYGIYPKIHSLCDHQCDLPADQHSYPHKVCRSYELEHSFDRFGPCGDPPHDRKHEIGLPVHADHKPKDPFGRNAVQAPAPALITRETSRASVLLRISYRFMIDLHSSI